MAFSCLKSKKKNATMGFYQDDINHSRGRRHQYVETEWIDEELDDMSPADYSDMDSEETQEATVVYKRKNGKGGIRQLMYQIPVRRNELDRDYITYAGYRFQPKPFSYSTAPNFIRTDVGVDFVDSKPKELSQGIRLVEPAKKISNIRPSPEFVEGLQKFRSGKKGMCTTWRKGDTVMFTDTKEMVEILERGLKGNELVAKIRYMEKSENPGLVVELPLIQLMAVGKLIVDDGQQHAASNGGDCYTEYRNRKTSTSSSFSSPSPRQPYYRTYSKPASHSYGLVYPYPGHDGGSPNDDVGVDTTDCGSRFSKAN